MKPLSLTVRNIGPFRDQTIDFTALGDIFLICGKTGAGKTTIFDAITYALYGKLPGARAAMNIRRLRSDFAEPNEPASVTLDYILNDEHFRVTRILPCKYVTRNGNESEKPEDVIVYRIRAADAEPISGNVSELNRFITDRLGLTHDEFARIVLLPQGEFAEFLRQSSAERRDTLAKLFPTQLYADFIERAKEKSNTAAAELDSVAQQLKQFSPEYEPAAAEAELERLNGELESCKNAGAAAQQRIISLETEKNKKRELLNVFAEAEKLRLKLEQLEADRADAEQAKRKIDRAAAAEPLAAAADEADRTLRSAAAVRVQLEETERQRTQAERELHELCAKEDRIKTAQIKLTQDETLLSRFAEAVRAERDLSDAVRAQLAAKELLEACTERIKHLETERAGIQEQLELPEYAAVEEAELEDRSEKRRLAGEALLTAEETAKRADAKRETERKLSRLQNERDLLQLEAQAAAERCAQAKSKLERYTDSQVLAERSNYARILAVSLHDGSPCPVCGALSHPNPAAAHGGTQELFGNETEEQAAAELNRLKADAEAAENAKAQALTRTARLDGTIEQLHAALSADEAVPDADTAQEQVKRARHAAQQAESAYNGALSVIRKKRELGNALQKIQDTLNPLHSQLTQHTVAASDTQTRSQTLRTKIAEIMQTAQNAGYAEETAVKTETAVRSAVSALQTEISTFTAAKQNAETLLARITGSITQLGEQSDIRAEESRAAQLRFEQLLARTDFADADEIRRALVPPSEKTVLTARFERWKTEYAETATLLQKHEAEANGCPQDIERELAQLEADTVKARSDFDTADTKYGNVLVTLEQTKNQLENWRRLEARRLECARTANLYRQLFSDVSGKNPHKIALDSWVLGVYLEEITAYASKRLHRISDGRYTLLLNQDTVGSGTKGLDLEILDAYTGKKRPCSTLSGGETFMASISLALALTDVVRSRSGGITLDALFIDEGFGSLDEASLEKALSILDEIRGTRCVGLISHVPGMKNRIPARLEVIKTAAGSFIRTVFTQDEE